MRGDTKDNQAELYSYIPLEARIPAKHPLRKIKEIIDSVLEEMDKEFNALYSHTGRPSVPPEMLLKALFLQVLYGIRSERLLLEQINFNFLYRWFVGLKPDDKIWDETVFSKNRERLLNGEIADKLFNRVVVLANRKKLISNDHFTVDGTLVEAWASLKSFQKKDGKEERKDDGDPGNPSVDFHGEKRSNKTHQSTTDPGAKLYRKSKGQTAKLSYMGHILMENRNGLAVGADTTEAGYFAEHESALEMIESLKTKGRRKTLGADKHYDNDDFCKKLRELKVTPHVSMNIHSRKHTSAIDERTTRHPGYEISQMKRKRVEEIFGWLKEFSIMRRPHFRGLSKIDYQFKFAVSVYNILRISNLMANVS